MAEYSEFEEIALDLEEHHGLFSQFWSMGVPRFTRKIPTAAVAFNRKGQYVEFIFNPDFWDQLSYEERKFVICHECLHVMFEHGIRMTNADQKHVANLAMDVVVNHTLIDDFGFSHSDLNSVVQEADAEAGTPEQTLDDVLIWKDKLYEKPDEIADKETFEYYYRKLMERVEEMIKNGQISTDGNGIPISMPGSGSGSPLDHDTIDSHEFMEGQGVSDQEDEADSGARGDEEEIDGQPDRGTEGLEPIPEEVMDDMVDECRRQLNPDENDQMTKAGIGRGDKVYKARLKKMQAVQKWEELVKKWTAAGEIPDDVWVRKSRRHNMLPPDFILPTEYEDENIGGKVNVWFFQDISGSCTRYLDHFYSAARTFPEHFFKLRMFGFDTGVIEVDPKNPNLRAGGGTCFKCIESAIQQKVQEGHAYPDAVFVFTDGCGTYVDPQHPDRWHWFLEGSYQATDYIPKQSKTYQLNDFVKDK